MYMNIRDIQVSSGMWIAEFKWEDPKGKPIVKLVIVMRGKAHKYGVNATQNNMRGKDEIIKVVRTSDHNPTAQWWHLTGHAVVRLNRARPVSECGELRPALRIPKVV
jgi:hypothetical protein